MSKGRFDIYTSPEFMKDEEEKRGRFDVYSPEDQKRIAERAMRRADPRLAVGQAAMNFPGSVKGVAEDIYSAVTSPIETAKAVGTLAESGVRKLDRLANKYIAGIETLPEGEEAIDAAIEGVKGRYGSGEAILDTLAEDPAGMMLDVAGVATPFKGARLFEPTGLVGKAAQPVVGRASDAMYKQAAGIPPSTLDAGTDLARRSAREGYAVAPRGLKSADAVKDAVNSDLNKMITDSMEGLPMIPKTTIVRGFDDLMEYYREVPDGTKAVEYLKKKRQEFLDEFPNRDDLHTFQVHKWKTRAYETAYEKAAKGKADRKVRAYRDSARTSKEALQEQIPGYKEANQKWATAAEIRPYIEERIDAIAKQEPGLAKTINTVLMRPGVMSQIAIGMRRLADGDLGWLEKNLNSAEIRTVLALAGRNQQNLEEENEPLRIEIRDGVTQ